MLIEMFLCKFLWIARKIRMLPKYRSIYELLHNYLWRYVALFLMLLYFILFASVRDTPIAEKIIENKWYQLITIILFIILSFFIQRYYRKKAKTKHIFYNKEYMQNKWSIPLFVLVLIFVWGGGVLLFFLNFV